MFCIHSWFKKTVRTNYAPVLGSEFWVTVKSKLCLKCGKLVTKPLHDFLFKAKVNALNRSAMDGEPIGYSS